MSKARPILFLTVFLGLAGWMVLAAEARKVRVTGGKAIQQLERAGARVIAEYESFSILDADETALQVLAGSDAVEVLDEADRILLNAGPVDTSRGEEKVRRARADLGKGRALHLVQFIGPVQPSWHDALLSAGFQIVDYIPENAYLVYGDTAALIKLRTMPARRSGLNWEGEYLPSDRLAPQTRTAMARLKAGEAAADLFAIQMFRDNKANAATLLLVEALKKAPIYRQDLYAHYFNVVVRLPADAVETLAMQPEVISIRPYIIPKKRDERQNVIVAGNLTGNGPSAPGYLNWLYSLGFTQTQFTASGFVVDVTDSGLDNGTTTPNHFGLYVNGNTALASRVAYARLEGTANSGSTIQGCDGHGTLNAHIIGGFNNFTGFPHADSAGYRYGLGVCPFVRVGSSTIFDPDNFTNPNYFNLIARAYRDGARISANSWGADTAGNYDIDAQQYDSLVRDAQQAGSAVPSNGNQEITIVFAAGNAGPNAQTVGSPGTAKNVITVGAAENVHSHSSTNGGNNVAGNDGCDTPDTQADSANDIAPFSSRGPCSDGRKKPEIVAPGTHITGGVAQQTRTMSGNGDDLACFKGSGVCGLPGGGTIGNTNNFFPQKQQWWSTSSGTSHSTPAVAGGAALVRQYFLNQGWPVPSPAMVKAFLVNAARYMTGTSAGDSLWSNNQGMGMMNLGFAFDATPRFRRDQVGVDTFTASGQSRTFSGWVSQTNKPVRVTLAWTDAPGSTTGNAYKNDLNLVVVARGLTYRGNVFSGAYSTTGGTADARNNTESVFLPAGTTGAVHVTVTAANINSDGVPNEGPALDQDFALVAYNFEEIEMPVVAPAGSALIAESCGAGNGAIDPDEGVTVRFALQNVGSADTTNVVATLLATGGVTAPSGAQSYGALLAGGPAVTNAYTFTATGTCGGTLTATLALQDGAVSLGNVSYTFTLGGSTTRSVTNQNTATVTIRDNTNALPYPSSISVAGLAGTVSKVVVTLSGFSHTYPEDVDVILVGPGGRKVALMGSVGGGTDVNNATLVFDDEAASPIGATITSGTYKPSGSVASMPSPAPTAPYADALSEFNGVSPTGTWSLYVADSAAGDSGSIASGWRLAITATAPLCCGSNKPPILAPIGNKSVALSNSLVFVVTATDPFDNDPVMLVASNLPPGATFPVVGGTGTFTWAVAAPTGTYSVTFNASDKDGAVAETISIAVNPIPVVDTNCTVIISEYVEGSSNNKAIELYNPGPTIIPLGTSNYVLQLFMNGGSTPGYNIYLTGTVAVAGTYVIAHSSAAAAILAVANQTSGSMVFNGDDAIVLRRGGTNGVVVDSLGQVGFDPGTEWGSGLTSTADNTLRRKTTVLRGDTNPYDIFDPAVEWDGYAQDTFTGLGSHTNNCTGPAPGTPPVLSPIGAKSILVSNTLTFAVVATPTDGDAVTLTASNLPSGAFFYPTNETGSFVWSVAAPVGVYTSVFNAADKDGAVSEAVVITVLAAGSSAMETFSNLNAPAGSYGSGSYVGDNGITWFYDGARKPDSTYWIDGQSVGFGDSTKNPRQVYSQSIAGGVGSLSVKYLKYFTGAGTRSFDVYVNTQLVGTVSDANNTTPQTATFSGLNIPGSVVLKIVGTGGKQFAVDSLSWTPYSGPPPGTPPVLHPIGDQSVGVGSNLQFTVTATPTDGDPVTLTASNLPAGAFFYPTNEAGSFVWNNASPTGTYGVTFNAADKDGADEETITITVAGIPFETPAIMAFAVPAGAIASATLTSVPGQHYALEYTTNLKADPVVWTQVDTEVGTGGVIMLSDPNPADVLRFYRVVTP